MNARSARPRTLPTLIGALVLLLTAGPASAVSVVINFDDLDDSTVVTNQYPEAIFSSETGIVNLTTAQDLGSSQPNFICTALTQSGIDCVHETIVDFTSPVSNLTFLEIGDDDEGANALIDVFVNGLFSATVNAVGDADPFLPNLVDLSAFSNVTRIRIHGITDNNGLGWDDFTFDVGTRQVPEPSALLLLGTGAVALAAAGRRRRGRK